MASNLNPPLKQRLNPLLSQPFSRGKTKHVKSNRIKRKIKVSPKHIILSFLLIAGLFFLVQQTYLFLITWEKLEVDNLEISTSKPELKHFVLSRFEEIRLGNLLLLDIDKMQKIIKANTWIKDVHIKKVFPSTVNIEIIERVPLAVIKKDRFYLIDRDGILLQPADPAQQSSLPLLTDDNRFKTGFEDKFRLAIKCLESVTQEHQKLIKTIDLSKYKCVSVKLDRISPWLILGDHDFSAKIQDYLDKQSYFAEFGEIQSINMRFKDRYILKPGKESSDNRVFMSGKEEADA